MKEFKWMIMAVVALTGFAVPSGAGADQLAQAQTGSYETRMQNCMKNASKSVCEQRIKGPSGEQKAGSNSEAEAMRKCMKFASQSACEKKIIGP